MDNKIVNKKSTWKNWIIKKLLTSDSNKEEILNYIATYDDKTSDQLEDNNEKSLIKNILSIDQKNVEDIMVPRAEIIAIEKDQNKQEIYSIIDSESHSRMPVYDENLDNVLGFLHVKDLLTPSSNKNFDLQEIIRDILYVAPKSPILDLLKRMRSSRIHMGLVVDEFGGIDGLITIEDLVEEIVGEIEDEHDAEDEEVLLNKINETTVIVNASFRIEDLEKYFNIELLLKKDEEIDTVGGMLFFIANKVPKNNQIFKYENILQFKVIKASARRIESIEIKRMT